MLSAGVDGRAVIGDVLSLASLYCPCVALFIIVQFLVPSSL